MPETPLAHCSIYVPGKGTCTNKARFLGTYTEKFSAQHGQQRLFCGVHANVRAASDGWRFTEVERT